MIPLMEGLVDNVDVNDVNEGLKDMDNDVLKSCLFFPFSDDADAMP